MNNKEYLKEVKNQYENYPYPFRNPQDELKRLICTPNDFLEKINYYCFKGNNDFNHNFRVLVAGDGTGDSTIFLAEQLKNKNAEVVYIDFSSASMEIAQKRAKIRGLKNIIWINDSLLELPNMSFEKYGKFDYINCFGVLHHLEDPNKGLQSLKSVLKENGCMNIMLYAKYGRTGIYQMQELMRLVNQNSLAVDAKVKNTKIILNSLPQTNWFKKGEELAVDHKLFGDAGIYDLFLHSQDRSYSITEVYDYIEKQDLNFISFTEPRGINLLLDPINYISDKNLQKELAEKPLKIKQSIAEIITGNIGTHTFYISNKKNTIADVNDKDNVPFFFPFLDNFGDCANIEVGKIVKIGLPDGNSIQFTQTKVGKFFFSIVDGYRTLKEIYEMLHSIISNEKTEKIISDFMIIFKLLRNYDLILLRNKKITPLKKVTEKIKSSNNQKIIPWLGAK